MATTNGSRLKSVQVWVMPLTYRVALRHRQNGAPQCIVFLRCDDARISLLPLRLIRTNMSCHKKMYGKRYCDDVTQQTSVASPYVAPCASQTECQAGRVLANAFELLLRTTQGLHVLAASLLLVLVVTADRAPGRCRGAPRSHRKTTLVTYNASTLKTDENMLEY